MFTNRPSPDNSEIRIKYSRVLRKNFLILEARASLSSSLLYLIPQENNGSNSDAARAQLTLSIPLYDGGKTSDNRAFKLRQQSIRKEKYWNSQSHKLRI